MLQKKAIKDLRRKYCDALWTQTLICKESIAGPTGLQSTLQIGVSMKKWIFTTLLLFCVVAGANAQNYPEIWLGGQIGFGTSKDRVSGRSSSTFSITPEVGYRFARHWAVAMAVGFSTSGARSVDQPRTTSFHINPFLRYSFLYGRMGYLFTDLTGSYQNSRQKHWGNNTANMNSFLFGIRPGFCFHFSPKVSAIGRIGFMGYQSHRDKMSNVNYDTFSANFDMQNFDLGVQFRF